MKKGTMLVIPLGYLVAEKAIASPHINYFLAIIEYALDILNGPQEPILKPILL